MALFENRNRLIGMALCLALAAAQACTSLPPNIPIEVTKQDPAFSLSLLKGKVLAVDGLLPTGEKEALPDWVTYALAKRDVKAGMVLSPESFEWELGPNESAALIRSYEKDRTLSKELLDRIGRVSIRADYLVLVRIVNDAVSRRRWRDERFGDGPGNTPSPKYVVAESSRKLKASLVLYDLHARARVWEGLATYSDSSEPIRYDRKSEVGSDPLGAFTANLSQVLRGEKEDVADKRLDEFYPYPDPPELRGMMPVLLSSLAKGVPEGQ